MLVYSVKLEDAGQKTMGPAWCVDSCMPIRFEKIAMIG